MTGTHMTEEKKKRIDDLRLKIERTKGARWLVVDLLEITEDYHLLKIKDSQRSLDIVISESIEELKKEEAEDE